MIPYDSATLLVLIGAVVFALGGVLTFVRRPVAKAHLPLVAVVLLRITAEPTAVTGFAVGLDAGEDKNRVRAGRV